MEIFYKYLFESGALNHQLSRLINTGIRNDGLLNLSPNDFFNCTVVLPEKKEQILLSKLFLTIDEEISLLKKYYAFLLLQKRGLMQKLLAGNLRVVV